MALGRAVKVAIKRAVGFSGIKQVRILRGPARGVSMNLDFAGQTPLYLGMFEWELHRWFREVLPGTHLVFDVGGHVGYDALLFAANTDAKVITFEPDPAYAEKIEANLAQNPGLEPRVTVNRSAIMGQDGDHAVTIDSISETTGPPDFIKIDIDGGEFDALLGGRDTLRRAKPHLVVETHSLELENKCGALLVDCGYRPVIKHNRRIWKETRGGAPHNRWLLATGDPRPH